MQTIVASIAKQARRQARHRARLRRASDAVDPVSVAAADFAADEEEFVE